MHIHTKPRYDFPAERLGVIMRAEPDRPQEAWAVLNPGGVRAADGTMHLFPRLIAEGNYSRIGHARVIFHDDRPVGVERLGIALEPHAAYEVNQGGGGVEDARIVYIPAIERFVMTYTAYAPPAAQIAVAVSDDLVMWTRLGVLRYEQTWRRRGLELIGNKDGVFFPSTVLDSRGVPSLAIVHRPTARRRLHLDRAEITVTPRGKLEHEGLWISYVALDAVLADIANLTRVGMHEHVMAGKAAWESTKIGAGSPPVRLPSGWLLPYHAVSGQGPDRRYCMGFALLDLERPTKVLYRSPTPVLEPEAAYERSGLVSNVIFPTAADLRAHDSIDIYYGAADHEIAVARVGLPPELTAPRERAMLHDEVRP